MMLNSHSIVKLYEVYHRQFSDIIDQYGSCFHLKFQDLLSTQPNLQAWLHT